MTIKDAVKAAIATLPGNKTFRIFDLDESLRYGSAESPAYSINQITRAIRDLPHVQRDGKGNYRVRGRRTPPR